MSGYGDFIRDFTERTLRNLDFIQAQASAGDRDAYEVTQLWNSLLGLIVLPRKRELEAHGGGIEQIPQTPMTELWSQGWPRVTVSGRAEHESLPDLVRHLRNAVAHFNVDFKPGTDSEITSVSAITSVTVWDQPVDHDGEPIKGSRRWEGQISVDDLDCLARLIAKEYLWVFV